jgi:hypothetical protein
MTKPGHIRIKPEGIIFEYYKLPEPIYSDYIKRKDTAYYQLDLEKYKASKRTVEVENDKNIDFYHLNGWLLINNEKCIIYSNQPCIAEITDKAEWKDKSGNERHLTKKIALITKII